MLRLFQLPILPFEYLRHVQTWFLRDLKILGGFNDKDNPEWVGA